MTMFGVLLVVHVMCGSVALLVGPVPMLSRKGGRLHRRAGFVYAAAMGVGAISAFALALLIHDRLLLTIAVLTAFLVFAGLRAIRHRHGVGRARIDGLAIVLLAGFGGWLLWRSAVPADTTGLFFGAGCLVLAARQWRLERSARPDWLLAHIAGMGGAYIATMTAFLVVNVTFVPKSVVFIVPPVVGSLLIAWASARHAARPTALRGPGLAQ